MAIRKIVETAEELGRIEKELSRLPAALLDKIDTAQFSGPAIMVTMKPIPTGLVNRWVAGDVHAVKLANGHLTVCSTLYHSSVPPREHTEWIFDFHGTDSTNFILQSM